MERTKVKVEFFITSETLNIETINDQLKLFPTDSWIQGDVIPGKKFKKTDSCWVIGTEYEESLDINDQLKKVLNILEERKEILKGIRKTNNYEMFFSIIINIENSEKPAIYFEKRFIDFIHEIGSEFFVDLYLFS